MPTRTWHKFTLLALAMLLAIPSLAIAGDSPIFVVGNWGVGEIDNRLMFYAGKDRYVITPIPAPPHGPRWDVVYDVFPFVVVGAVAFWLYRRRHNPTLQRTGAARRGFEVQEVSDSGPGR